MKKKRNETVDKSTEYTIFALEISNLALKKYVVQLLIIVSY